MPFLTIVSGVKGSGGGRRYQLTGDQIFIGRNPGNDVAVEGIGVAGYHARILRTEHGHLLIEERASNGIFVEEQRVTNLFLHHGARFRLGNVVFLFETDEAGAPEAPEEPEAPEGWSDAITRQAAPSALDLAPAPAPAPAAAGRRDTPPWAQAELGQQEPAFEPALAEALEPAPSYSLDGSSQYQALGNNCPGCKAPLVGMERYCSMCGSRTKFGGRGRVLFFKFVLLLLIAGAGGMGVYTLTDGELTREGYARALDRVFAGEPPGWLKL